MPEAVENACRSEYGSLFNLAKTPASKSLNDCRLHAYVFFPVVDRLCFHELNLKGLLAETLNAPIDGTPMGAFKNYQACFEPPEPPEPELSAAAAAASSADFCG